MSIRRPSFLLGAVSLLSAAVGVLGGVFGGRGGTIAANTSRDAGRKPTTRGRQPRKSLIRGSGSQAVWAKRHISTGKEICDARNHYRGKIYSALDRYFLAQAEAKRERKRLKRVRDAEAQCCGSLGYGIPTFYLAA